MNEDYTAEPGVLTRIGWFFWRNWNRLVCVTRGHNMKDNYICNRCGLPVPTWQEIDDLKAELRDEREDRKAFHQHYAQAEADADALRGEHRA